MVADYRKYNAFVDSIGGTNALTAMLPQGRYPTVRRAGTAIIRRYARWDARRRGVRRLDPAEDDVPRPGRWYHTGTRETAETFRAAGFTVLDADMGVDPRSPVLHVQA